ncbi:D-2-hydroxyacid dehydrogenase [Devosia sp.]|uniref:D-2-hydroxyacid dehydrogenase n=1 Tax=Devosia sp. TaxID=1871048 RepID=UPI002F002E82
MRTTFWAQFDFARETVGAALRAVPGAEVAVVRTLPELLERLPTTEFLVLADATVAEAREVVARLRSPDRALRWMHFNSAGRDGFNAAGIPEGITVTQAFGALAPTVAEHALALLLTLARQVPFALGQQAQAAWVKAPEAGMRTLDGATMLLVGLGHIGREIARRARAFGLRVVAVNRSPRQAAEVDEVRPLTALNQMLPRADYVVACIALAPETHGILGREALALCRPGAILVNVGRGGLIDSVALAEALQTGRLGGAGLDVTEPEPLPPGHPLWRAPNLVITPHVAGVGRGAENRLAVAAATQLAAAVAAGAAGATPFSRPA